MYSDYSSMTELYVFRTTWSARHRTHSNRRSPFRSEDPFVDIDVASYRATASVDDIAWFEVGGLLLNSQEVLLRSCGSATGNKLALFNVALGTVS